MSGMQLYRVVTAPPNAAHGWLIGALVGYVIGTIITVVLVARAKPAPPKPAPPPEVKKQKSDKYTRWAKKAYITCAIAWSVTVVVMVVLAFFESEIVAAVVAVIAGISFFGGLAALITGKALGDASRR